MAKTLNWIAPEPTAEVPTNRRVEAWGTLRQESRTLEIDVHDAADIRQNQIQLNTLQFAIHLPWYLRLMLAPLLVVVVVVASVMTLTRYIQPSPNPFFAYAGILTGHPEQAAIEQGFTCFAITFDDRQRCTRRDETASSPFSRVYLLTLRDHIYTLSFEVHANTLTVGDLTLLWGGPEFNLSGTVVAVRWPSRNITALVVLPSGRLLNYFTPVAFVTFTSALPPAESTKVRPTSFSTQSSPEGISAMGKRG